MFTTIFVYYTIEIIFLHVSCVEHNEVSGINKNFLPLQESKIIEGHPVSIEEFPFAAQFYNFGSMCSGTIINSWSVLTAAHCFDNNKEVSDMIVQIGARFAYDDEGQILEVWYFLIHEDYNRAMTFACDIAIVFVSHQMEFGSKVKKAPLVNNGNWMRKEEERFLVAGWGWTKYGGHISDSGLMMTHLKFIPKKQCEQMHNVNLTDDMFCLYGDGVRDTCKGDSGAGVLWKDIIVGIVSHGDGCSKEGKPSIYSNVWYFSNWIQSSISQFARKLCHEQKQNSIILL